MSITNTERMVDALVNDEVNYLRSLDRGDLFVTLEEMIRDKFELMSNNEITELHEGME
jgi:hypothetical protein